MGWTNKSDINQQNPPETHGQDVFSGQNDGFCTPPHSGTPFSDVFVLEAQMYRIRVLVHRQAIS